MDLYQSLSFKRFSQFDNILNHEVSCIDCRRDVVFCVGQSEQGTPKIVAV